MKFIILSIAVILNSVTIIIFIRNLNRRIEEVKYYRDHISRIKQNEIDKDVKINRTLIDELASESNKKVVPVYDKCHIGPKFITGYKLVDLTDKEKEAQILMKRLKELEVEEVGE